MHSKVRLTAESGEMQWRRSWKHLVSGFYKLMQCASFAYVLTFALSCVMECYCIVLQLLIVGALGQTGSFGQCNLFLARVFQYSRHDAHNLQGMSLRFHLSLGCQVPALIDSTHT